ncbi:MAG TPA: DUF1080 domain-containing protein [Isosphaeraceae bacterium]|jgi:hypothetical protein|nr:DUF1080 domain-containing protein [Isosphaeraceae bacterium]
MTLLAALIASAALAADAPSNTPPPGFAALFNGTDLTNWKNEGKAKGHWTVKDGALHYDGKGDSLVTAKDYGDFELYVDWKIHPKGDSGIYLRGKPQVQIWDNPIGSGGLYNNKVNPSKPLTVADKPVGEWNTFHIIMKGDKVTVFLNGQKVVDNTPLENWPNYDSPLPAKGTIELQHHGDELEFRNIYLKEL